MRRLRRLIRENIPYFVAALAITALYTSPSLLSGFWVALMFGARLLFAVAFILIQFVAMFAFLGKAKTEVILPSDDKAVTLDDYWGQPHLVDMVREWVGFLREPEGFEKLGGRMVRGILLSGAPGTGKTWLARCLSGSANLPFISIEGSGFRAMFIGIDVIKMIQFIGKAKRLARDYGACIAFIDEIDAVGASRGGVMEKGGLGTRVYNYMMGGMMGGGSGALTRLLYELDGIETPGRFDRIKRFIYERLLNKEMPSKRQHVLFIGSTNRPDILDPALKRPGRFDKNIVVDPPDREGREAIIKGYLKKIKSRDIDVDALVADTTKWTPAEVMSSITKDAVRFAMKAKRDYVTHDDIDAALQEAKMGMANPIGSMEDSQRRALAVHESGHAIAQYFLMPDTRIVRLTIVRHGRAYGYMMPTDDVEQYIVDLERLVNNFRVAIASREAEKLVLGKQYNSVGGDYLHAGQVANLLYRTGYFGVPADKADSPRAIRKIAKFWKQQEEFVSQLLTEHREELDRLTERLLEKGSLGSREIIECIAGKSGSSPPSQSS